MTNSMLLEEKIRESGFRKGFLAEKMGLHETTFWQKVTGKRQFRQSEIVSLCSLLGINDVEEIQRIFLCPKV